MLCTVVTIDDGFGFPHGVGKRGIGLFPCSVALCNGCVHRRIAREERPRVALVCNANASPVSEGHGDHVWFRCQPLTVPTPTVHMMGASGNCMLWPHQDHCDACRRGQPNVGCGNDGHWRLQGVWARMPSAANLQPSNALNGLWKRKTGAWLKVPLKLWLWVNFRILSAVRTHPHPTHLLLFPLLQHANPGAWYSEKIFQNIYVEMKLKIFYYKF